MTLSCVIHQGYTRSVKSVMYVKDERLVATAGANDGVVKFWNTRKLKSPVAQSSFTRIAPVNSRREYLPLNFGHLSPYSLSSSKLRTGYTKFMVSYCTSVSGSDSLISDFA
ncbi:hypothetical protein R1flu_004778 [Riccia fluitans]|uniref:Uncharacterized protein n=1 Tax=Riccia fluitans TaxID=41844 RepID=A0ABD1YS88_9MARC